MNKIVNFGFVAIVALICLSSATSAKNIPQPAEQQPTTPMVELRDVQLVKDIRAFVVAHPNLKLIRLNKKESANKSQTVKYSLGNRISADRLVAQYGDTFFYPAKKDVTTQVTYPETGTGSVVTAVEINCLQDTNEGNAYVVAGGIGQRFISVVLEATQTERFSYNIHVYGTD